MDKYPGMTPYNYTANNPIIKFIDVNGDSIDVSMLLKIGNMKQSDLVKNVINDLQDISGLSLSIGNNGKLNYDTDKNGKPIYSGGSQEDSYLPFNRVSLNSLNKGLIPLKSRIKIVK